VPGTGFRRRPQFGLLRALGNFPNFPPLVAMAGLARNSSKTSSLRNALDPRSSRVFRLKAINSADRHVHYAVEAFGLEAMDYLLKPISARVLKRLSTRSAGDSKTGRSRLLAEPIGPPHAATHQAPGFARQTQLHAWCVRIWSNADDREVGLNQHAHDHPAIECHSKYKHLEDSSESGSRPFCDARFVSFVTSPDQELCLGSSPASSQMTQRSRRSRSVRAQTKRLRELLKPLKRAVQLSVITISSTADPWLIWGLGLPVVATNRTRA